MRIRRIVVITGSRHLSQERDVWDFLNEQLNAAKREEKRLELFVGDAKGADLAAARWARSRDIESTVFSAAWETRGKRAGPLRNERMVNSAFLHKQQGHIVVAGAFPVGRSPGTRGTIDLLKLSGIETTVFELRSF